MAVTHTQDTIPYAELVCLRLEDGIDPTRKEDYLTEEEFTQVRPYSHAQSRIHMSASMPLRLASLYIRQHGTHRFVSAASSQSVVVSCIVQRAW